MLLFIAIDCLTIVLLALYQHLQLVQALIDPEAEIEAWKLVSVHNLVLFIFFLLIQLFCSIYSNL